MSRRVYEFLHRIPHIKRLQAITRYLYRREREMLRHGYSG